MQSILQQQSEETYPLHAIPGVGLLGKMPHVWEVSLGEASDSTEPITAFHFPHLSTPWKGRSALKIQL